MEFLVPKTSIEENIKPSLAGRDQMVFYTYNLQKIVILRGEISFPDFFLVWIPVEEWEAVKNLPEKTILWVEFPNKENSLKYEDSYMGKIVEVYDGVD